MTAGGSQESPADGSDAVLTDLSLSNFSDSPRALAVELTDPDTGRERYTTSVQLGSVRRTEGARRFETLELSLDDVRPGRCLLAVRSEDDEAETPILLDRGGVPACVTASAVVHPDGSVTLTAALA